MTLLPSSRNTPSQINLVCCPDICSYNLRLAANHPVTSVWNAAAEAEARARVDKVSEQRRMLDEAQRLKNEIRESR
jgi:hypothetical protein